MKLNAQAIKIHSILKTESKPPLSNGFHCPIEWNYADGHTKRFTDLNRFLEPQNQVIEGRPCICGRHVGKPSFMRRIVPLKIESNTVIMADEKAKDPIKVEQGITPEYLKMLYAD